MNQLERDCGIDSIFDVRIVTTTRAIHQQDEGRAKPLPARIDEVMANLRDDRFVGVEQPRKFRFGGYEIGLDDARGADVFAEALGLQLICFGFLHV